MKILFHFLITILNITYIFAQENSLILSEKPDTINIIHDQYRELKPLTWYEMFTKIPDDYCSFGKNMAIADNIGSLFGVITISGITNFGDQNLLNSTKIFSEKNLFINNTKDKIVFLGDGRFSLLTAALFSLYGWLSNDQKHLRTSSNLIEALLTTGILVQILKRTFGRESPAAATSKNGRWNFFPSFKDYHQNQPKYYSFPSGHIATLTSTVMVIANNYPEEKWIKPLGFTAIGLVGYSLVAKGWHWYSDLPLGFYLGYTIGNIVTPPENKNSFVKSQHTRYSIVPFFYDNGVIINYTLEF